jgi:hypothetical protein
VPVAEVAVEAQGLQMVAVECGEVPDGLVGRDTGERSGVGVEVDTGMRAEAAEEAVPVGGQVLVGQVERGGDGAVLGGYVKRLRLRGHRAC